MRYSKKDEETLKKKVRNYNAKINRLKKKGYNENLLPQKKKLKEEREKAKQGERKDFNSLLKSVDTFLNRGSEEIVKSTRGLQLPKFRLSEIKAKLRKVNNERKKQREKYENIEITDRNKTGVQGMINERSMNINKLEDKHFNFKNMSKKDFTYFEKTLNNELETKLEKKNRIYRENFYKAMENNYNENQYEKLKKVIDNISTDILVEKYYTDLNMDLDFHYDESEQQIKYEETLNAWGEIMRDNIYENVDRNFSKKQSDKLKKVMDKMEIEDLSDIDINSNYDTMFKECEEIIKKRNSK